MHLNSKDRAVEYTQLDRASGYLCDLELFDIASEQSGDNIMAMVRGFKILSIWLAKSSLQLDAGCLCQLDPSCINLCIKCIPTIQHFYL